MAQARVWMEKVMIPTYEIGEAEKNPIFLDKRVYQGSSGKVYPYPTVEKLSDEKKDKDYEAVFLENEYLRVMVLPELGGRIQRAYDKTNGYDFVYYNHVIKPALVGLTGPWISGGIEFNWPQHHRPTTFLPVDYEIVENEDGSGSVLLHDVDQMYGTQGLMKITVYPGRAYIEISGQLYNRTGLPQTFLWWANPAVSVNDNTQSIFPPDVHAVMDHGKRDVSRFPIATGVYYKKDYSEGVDISRYKNIPVPTSYMAEKSKYDFVGGYDYGVGAGILHVADHHISPGKKQWTWGCGDFGRAWDRNLTDEDGPYIELMTGMFTDNQPDFSWLKPFEEKTFTQYFMPYKAVGQVKNASREAAVHLSLTDGRVKIVVYATAVYEEAEIVLRIRGQEVLREKAKLSPVDIYERELLIGDMTDGLRRGRAAGCEQETGVNAESGINPESDGPAASGWPRDMEESPDPAGITESGMNPESDGPATPGRPRNMKESPGPAGIMESGANAKSGAIREEELQLVVYAGGECLVEYQPEAAGIPSIPQPAQAAQAPEKIMTNEELYLTGLHIEQYRHATYRPDPYYLEGLKRDPGDIRINTAYGALLLRRGQFTQAEPYFRKALERLTWKNPNPYDGEAYYLLGLDLFYQERLPEAYDAFYKAVWSNEQQEMSFYYLAVIAARAGRFAQALPMAEKGLVKNAHNIKARGLKAYLLRKLGRTEEAAAWVEENLALDPFDFVSGNEEVLLAAESGEDAAEFAAALRRNLNRKMRGFRENYLMTARDYAEFGAYREAVGVLSACGKEYPMLAYYEACYRDRLGEDVTALLERAEAIKPDYCFPNKPEDIAVLRFAIARGCTAKAAYYLGNLFYDKQQWKEALALWETSAEADGTFPTVWRNLSLIYYNQCGDRQKAKAAMEKAFSLNPADARVFLELDQLYKKLGRTFEERLANYEAHPELTGSRDDLYIEYITLVNLCGDHEKAYRCIMGRKFHPWEGGEGKVTTQYTLALLEMAKEALKAEDYRKAEQLLRQALVFPENLGEGKLEGDKDNPVYYYLGLALEGQGRTEEARACFERATEGTDEPAGAMYYNDQPADRILYHGLAYLKLGRVREARARFWRLIDYGERHLEDPGRIEYFAVSLPEFLIFDEDYTARNRAHCYYLMALGNIGLGDREKAADFLAKAVEIEPSHMMCRIYARGAAAV